MERAPKAGQGVGGTGWMAGLALAVFVGTAGLLWSQQRAVLRAALVDDRLAASGAPRPEINVHRAVTMASLITVALDTSVTAQSADSSWRGDVSASVSAPVRVYFGTDLSNLEESAVRVDPFGGAMVVMVPRPRRLATEVLGESERSEVNVGWARLRSVAGEYRLGLARKGLYQAAREMTLTPADAELVQRATRDRVEALVKAVAGERTAVEVRFAGEAGSIGAGSGAAGATP
ncbi:MAG: hypothetical protein J0L61_08685 [Planctomycetes bacterium]|nr:hypothetical protein [Planctomycetota bacterium]